MGTAGLSPALKTVALEKCLQCRQQARRTEVTEGNCTDCIKSAVRYYSLFWPLCQQEA